MIRQFAWIDVMFLVAALRWTLALSVVAFAGGALIGAIVAVLRFSRLAPVRLAGAAYTQLVQGMPLLVWIFGLYFGLAIFGFPVGPWTAASCALSVYASAYLGEIWRGALLAIPRTQWEAGASLGLGQFNQLRYVIVPQALRVATPPTVGFLVQLIKDTSLASTIGFVELTREGQTTTAATFQPFTVYMTVAVLYFLMCFPLTQLSRRLERGLHGAR
jgi:polar amino acid transport system permease protein